jgi:hypothetical protein
LCPSARGQRLGAGFEEKAEREEEVVGQGCFLERFAHKEKKKQERKKKGVIWPKFI